MECEVTAKIRRSWNRFQIWGYPASLGVVAPRQMLQSSVHEMLSPERDGRRRAQRESTHGLLERRHGKGPAAGRGGGGSGAAPSARVRAAALAWLPPGRDQKEHCPGRSEEHTSELQSPCNLVCRLLLEKKKE